MSDTSKALAFEWLGGSESLLETVALIRPRKVGDVEHAQMLTGSEFQKLKMILVLFWW